MKKINSGNFNKNTPLTYQGSSINYYTRDVERRILALAVNKLGLPRDFVTQIKKEIVQYFTLSHKNALEQEEIKNKRGYFIEGEKKFYFQVFSKFINELDFSNFYNDNFYSFFSADKKNLAKQRIKKILEELENFSSTEENNYPESEVRGQIWAENFSLIEEHIWEAKERIKIIEKGDIKIRKEFIQIKKGTKNLEETNKIYKDKISQLEKKIIKLNQDIDYYRKENENYYHQIKQLCNEKKNLALSYDFIVQAKNFWEFSFASVSQRLRKSKIKNEKKFKKIFEVASEKKELFVCKAISYVAQERFFLEDNYFFYLLVFVGGGAISCFFKNIWKFFKQKGINTFNKRDTA